MRGGVKGGLQLGDFMLLCVYVFVSLCHIICVGGKNRPNVQLQVFFKYDLLYRCNCRLHLHGCVALQCVAVGGKRERESIHVHESSQQPDSWAAGSCGPVMCVPQCLFNRGL